LHPSGKSGHAELHAQAFLIVQAKPSAKEGTEPREEEAREALAPKS
jgi:hypothetical protein